MTDTGMLVGRHLPGYEAFVSYRNFASVGREVNREMGDYFGHERDEWEPRSCNRCGL